LKPIQAVWPLQPKQGSRTFGAVARLKTKPDCIELDFHRIEHRHRSDAAVFECIAC